jgi:hypothetical protein
MHLKLHKKKNKQYINHFEEVDIFKESKCQGEVGNSIILIGCNTKFTKTLNVKQLPTTLTSLICSLFFNSATKVKINKLVIMNKE